MASKTAQQSVHLMLGILCKSQAVFYAFSFFWLDGFAVPGPAQVTQTVQRPLIPQQFFHILNKGQNPALQGLFERLRRIKIRLGRQRRFDDRIHPRADFG